MATSRAKPNSASLDDAALAIVQQAGTAARANPMAAVTVVGFASPETGTVESNKALALARAQAVANALAAAGVAQDRIRIEPWGARAYGVTPTESHRVEIVVS